MKTHMNSRHKFEVSECHICKKGYFNAERLKTHLRSHIEKEKYECSLCAWKFRTYNILCSHIKRHHAMEKSQITCQCDFCGAEYLSKMHLENHLKKIHSGPYGCFIKECKSRFTCQSTRKNHYLLLHNCDQNQMVFILMFSLSLVLILLITFTVNITYVFQIGIATSSTSRGGWYATIQVSR